jgi:hypothetical protein
MRGGRRSRRGERQAPSSSSAAVVPIAVCEELIVFRMLVAKERGLV